MKSTAKGYILRTLGCKANLYDSQLLESELQERGWIPKASFDDEVQLCIVNSCTVTDEADRQTRKMAARLARDNPQASIVVTGCAAEVDPEGLARSKGVHFVVGNQNKNELIQIVLQKVEQSNSILTSHILQAEILGTVSQYEKILSKHPLDREWPAAIDSFQTPPTQLRGHAEKTRSFLKIQEGCNSFCTYCIIPYGRGPNRSLEPERIVEQIKQLVQEGIREVIITGTNIGDYGTEWAPTAGLDDLLEKILRETDLERLRVSSLDPTEVTPRIRALMESDSRFCPHFHVSLQSPHSRILRLMKRKYGFTEVEECLHAINQLQTSATPTGGAFVGMDVITGFPGETDEEFAWGVEALRMLPWTRLHVFPYSERAGTPATRLPSAVPQHLRVQRAKILNKLSLERLTAHYRGILEKCQSENLTLDAVLMEKSGPQQWTAGYTPNYLRVLIPKTEDGSRNQLLSVRPLDLMIDVSAVDVALVCQPVTS
jgi:threonylcarbamoyladenosine tRNA methylthiotransferase MtaB